MAWCCLPARLRLPFRQGQALTQPCPLRCCALQVNDAVVFAAEVLVLRESCDVRHLPLLPSEAAAAAGASGAPAGVPALPAPADGEAAGGRPASAASDGAGSSGSVAVAGSSAGGAGEKSKTVFTWRIENFQAFKDIMETRKARPAGGPGCRRSVRCACWLVQNVLSEPAPLEALPGCRCREAAPGGY